MIAKRKRPLKKENILCLCGVQLHPISYGTENRITLSNYGNGILETGGAYTKC